MGPGTMWKRERTEEISRSRRLFGFSVSPFKILKGQTVRATESVFYQRLPSKKHSVGFRAYRKNTMQPKNQAPCRAFYPKTHRADYRNFVFLRTILMFAILPPRGTAFCFIAKPQDGEGYRRRVLPEASFKSNRLASGRTERITPWTILSCVNSP
jgi:hypothetical protein